MHRLSLVVLLLTGCQNSLTLVIDQVEAEPVPVDVLAGVPEAPDLGGPVEPHWCDGEFTGTTAADADSDGLSDTFEFANGLDPHAPDSDQDGLFDGHEVQFCGTDPLNPDTDGDGLLDGTETHPASGRGTDPRNADSDYDGLPDGVELEWSLPPLNPDMDRDGLSDGDEVNHLGTNPDAADSDGDGLSDWEEHQLATDPWDPMDGPQFL